MKKVLIILVLLILTVSIAGCSNMTKSSSVGKGLSLNKFVFCNEINGDRDYVENTNKTFMPGKECLAYFEVTGFKYQKDNGTLLYHPVVEAEIKNPDGKVAVARTKIIDKEMRGKSPAPYIYFPISFTLPQNTKEGKYTLTIYVTDAIGKGTLKANEEFFIKNSG